LKRTLIALSILAAALALSPAAVADTLVGTAGYGWQDWDVADLNENGTPYWDRTSFDTGKKNIGDCLTGTGDCTTTNFPAWTDRPGNLDYWGWATGAADPNFYMKRSGTGVRAPDIKPP
jgi:hypothetical protein